MFEIAKLSVLALTLAVALGATSCSSSDDTGSDTDGTATTGADDADTERTDGTDANGTDSTDGTDGTDGADAVAGADGADGADGVEAVCWAPEEATGNADCTAICARVEECGGEPADECEEACGIAVSYMTADASAALEACMTTAECGFAEGGELFEACAVEIGQNGDVTPPETNQAQCDAVIAAMAECGAPEEQTQGFTGICGVFATIFTAEAMDMIGACADAECKDIGICLGAANCLMGGDDEPADGGDG